LLTPRYPLSRAAKSLSFGGSGDFVIMKSGAISSWPCNFMDQRPAWSRDYLRQRRLASDAMAADQLATRGWSGSSSNACNCSCHSASFYRPADPRILTGGGEKLITNNPSRTRLLCPNFAAPHHLCTKGRAAALVCGQIILPL